MIPSSEKIGEVILNRVRDRLLSGVQSWVGVVIGQTGTGKSWSACALAEMIDPSLTSENLHERLFFDGASLIKAVREGTVKAGQMTIWDESGIGMGSRNAMTKINKYLGFFLQSWRAKNIGLLMTLPSVTMLDNQARQLAHSVIETMRIDKEHNKVVVKWFDCQLNAMSGKVYRKKPWVNVNGLNYKVGELSVPKPSVKVQHEYLKMKEKFLDNLISDLHIKTDTNLIEFKETKKPNMDDIINTIVQNPAPYMRTYNHRQFIDARLIKDMHSGLTVDDSRIIKARAEQYIEAKNHTEVV